MSAVYSSLQLYIFSVGFIVQKKKALWKDHLFLEEQNEKKGKISGILLGFVIPPSAWVLFLGTHSSSAALYISKKNRSNLVLQALFQP